VGGFQFGSYGYNVAGQFHPGRGYAATPAIRNEKGLGGRLISSDNWRTYVAEPTSENSIVSPSDMILIGDAVLGKCSAGASWAVAGWQDRLDHDVFFGEDNDSDVVIQGYARRHLGRWNISFCDGHVENLKTHELFSQRNAKVLRRWNNDNQAH
jgi:prepilin-type processing-associated H-X9-DG protein